MKRGLKERFICANRISIIKVATIAPMKRGLKGITGDVIHTIQHVATIAPMKRGLKGLGAWLSSCAVRCSNHCPDEKGTERHQIRFYRFSPMVATIAPMKRGLKGRWRCSFTTLLESSNHCPDEKGTESASHAPVTPLFLGSNHCPDEKGTERT